MTLDSKIFGNEDDSAREHRFEKRPAIPESDVQRAIEHVRNVVSDLQTVDVLVKTPTSALSAERVVTDTPSIGWDWATAGQAKANVQFASEAEHITGTDTTKAANAAGVRAAMDEGIWEVGTITNAVTLDLGSVHNLRVLVQGNANPSSFGTTPNLIRFLEFDTASIIIHNSTTLRCPGATNITTQAGSRYICTSDSSGNWTVWTGFHTNGAMQNANCWQASWGAAYWARGAVTAAATTTLTTSNAPIQVVAGSTGIGSFGSGANRVRWLNFTGTPLITHSSALVCPGNVNLQVAAGAWAFVSSDASGNWTIMFYAKSDGSPLYFANDSVTNAALRDSAALSVIGRSANSAGDPADIAAANDGEVLRRSGTTLGFGTVATAGIADDAVTFAKMQNVATDRLMGRDTASTGDPEEISLDSTLEFTGSASIRRAALTGDVTASAGSNSTTIANDAVTYAKMQNISATSRILGRKTSGAGDTEECTLSEVLDFIGSAAQGDILYRGSSGWARLGAGTSGQFLKTNGAAANPQWDAVTGGGGLALLTSGTVSSAATLDVVLTGYTSYRGLRFVLSNFVPATDQAGLMMRVSTDGGSNYDASSGNYRYASVSSRSAAGPAAFNSDSATRVQLVRPSTAQGPSNDAAEGTTVIIDMFSQTSTGSKQLITWVAYYYEATAGIEFITGGGVRDTAQDTDAVRFLMETGNIASGSYAVYGYA
ncbi:MAG: hypothetical protein ACKVP3_23675 [Hyphomicrobiaceae bacterium]